MDTAEDHIINVNVKIPSKLPKEELEALKKIAEIRRSGWRWSKSFFQILKKPSK